MRSILLSNPGRKGVTTLCCRYDPSHRCGRIEAGRAAGLGCWPADSPLEKGAMTYFSLSVEIQASSERVWEVLSNIECWPAWTPTVTSIQRVDRGPLAVGSQRASASPSYHRRCGRSPSWMREEVSPGSPAVRACE